YSSAYPEATSSASLSDWMVVDKQGDILNNISTFASITSGLGQFGRIDAQEGLFNALSVNSLSSTGSLSATEIGVGEFNLSHSDDTFSISTDSTSLFTLDRQGNASLSGELTAQSGTFDTLTVNTLTVNEIIGLTARSTA